MDRPIKTGIASLGFLTLVNCSEAPVEPSHPTNIVWAVGNNNYLNGQLERPMAIAIEAGTSNVYVLDENNPLSVFSADGTFLERKSNSLEFFDCGGMTFTSSGTLLVTDRSLNRVVEMQKNGSFVREWGEKGSGQGQLDNPGGIAVGANYNIYVTDSNNDRIQVFDAHGTFLRSWGSRGTGAGQFEAPVPIAIDAAGMVYVGDLGNHRVQKFDAEGTWIAEWGTIGTEDGEFGGGFTLTVSATGEILTLEPSLRVQRFNSDGGYLGSWTGSGVPAWGGELSIATNAQGMVFTVGLRNFGIQTYDSHGSLRAGFGKPSGSGPGQFSHPYAITGLPDGSVLVGEASWGRIQHLNGNGEYMTEWDLQEALGTRDLATGPDGSIWVLGFAYENEMVTHYTQSGTRLGGWTVSYFANAVAVDEQGRVWICDVLRDRIFAFNASGQKLNEWGTSGSGPGELSHPVSLAVSEGNVVVCDSKSISVFTETGEFKRSLVGWEEYDRAYEKLSVDDQGNVYAASFNQRKISSFSLYGLPEREFIYESPGALPADLLRWYPLDVSVASDGVMFVSYIRSTGDPTIIVEAQTTQFRFPQ